MEVLGAGQTGECSQELVCALRRCDLEDIEMIYLEAYSADWTGCNEPHVQGFRQQCGQGLAKYAKLCLSGRLYE